MAFQKIQIIGFNEAASNSSGRGSLMNMHLELSASPAMQWLDLFDQNWKQHFYMLKRHVNVSGAELIVECMPDELQGHIDELKKVVAETNAQFNKMIADDQKSIADAQAADEERRRKLAELKGNLKFD